MKRSVVREHVFRILFRYEFCAQEEFDSQKKLYFEVYPDLSDYPEYETFNLNIKTAITDENPAVKPLDRAEIESRVNDIIGHIAEIDEKLVNVCTGWKIERIGKAELAVLRLAIYEILFDDSVDAGVAISEAVVLCRKYCDDKSYSFVNGVLSKLVKPEEDNGENI